MGTCSADCMSIIESPIIEKKSYAKKTKELFINLFNLAVKILSLIHI